MGESQFHNQVVLITGAAGGQGNQHARRFAREGAKLVLTDRRTEGDRNPGLEDVANQLRAAGHEVLDHVADTRDKRAMANLADEAVKRFSRLDVVVANAGISTRKPSHEITEQDWAEMLEVNVTGTWNTCIAAIPHMIRQQRGAITIVSSIASHKGMAELAHYSTAKHALNGVVRSLALEYGKHSIRVNAVSPTRVNTPMLHRPEIVERMLPGIENPTIEDLKGFLQQSHALPVPWIEATDVSAAVCWLSSDEARYITGVNLPIDAGAVLL